jgi:hypothetical protein
MISELTDKRRTVPSAMKPGRAHLDSCRNLLPDPDSDACGVVRKRKVITTGSGITYEMPPDIRLVC